MMSLIPSPCLYATEADELVVTLTPPPFQDFTALTAAVTPWSGSPPVTVETPLLSTFTWCGVSALNHRRGGLRSAWPKAAVEPTTVTAVTQLATRDPPLTGAASFPALPSVP